MKTFLLALCLSLTTVNCGKSSDKKTTSQTEVVPNVCKSMSLVGTFPDSNGNNFETNALVCFEGYELDSVGHKQYLASLKCEEAKILAARGDTSAQQYYEPFSSTVCPKEGVIASCETTTQKVLVYPDNKNLFNLTAFKGYCKATGGQLNNYTN